jgi:hypothetical protein
VLSRILEYLHIICVKLARINGLVFEEYLPAAEPAGLWLPAPHSVVNYGAALGGVRRCCRHAV